MVCTLQSLINHTKGSCSVSRYFELSQYKKNSSELLRKRKALHIRDHSNAIKEMDTRRLQVLCPSEATWATMWADKFRLLCGRTYLAYKV